MMRNLRLGPRRYFVSMARVEVSNLAKLDSNVGLLVAHHQFTGLAPSAFVL